MAICNDILNNNKLVNEYNINIDNLVIENIKINEIINELKSNDNIQKDEIKNQNIKIEKLKIENKEIKQENKEIKYKINKMENRFYITKIITALQDLNSCDKLEIKLNTLNKSLKKLRNNRNTCNHYIYDDDDEDNINKKKTYLLNQLINISEDIKSNINKSYGTNLIETIIEYLKYNTDTNSEVSEEDLSYIESWWEY